MLRTRLAHILTGYHHRRRGGNKLGVCTCGWRCWMFRKLDWLIRWRKFSRLCWLRGHVWGPTEDMHCGPAGFEESDDTYVASWRQCERCFSMNEVNGRA